LLVSHEGKIKRTGLRFVSRIRADYGESARERRFVSCVLGSRGIRNHTIAAAAAHHHEVAIPGGCLRQSYGEADAELFTTSALAAVDYAVYAAVGRQLSTNGYIKRPWNHNSPRNWLGFCNLNAIKFQADKPGAGNCRLTLGNRSRAKSRGRQEKGCGSHCCPSFLSQKCCRRGSMKTRGATLLHMLWKCCPDRREWLRPGL
jgi:hypothetical protein